MVYFVRSIQFHRIYIGYSMHFLHSLFTGSFYKQKMQSVLIFASFLFLIWFVYLAEAFLVHMNGKYNENEQKYCFV